MDQLHAAGVRHAVLAPGARSAPLSYAAHDHEDIELRVVHDERAAAFMALGAAKATRRPAAVITTSGTAVANLHPAMLEAHHSLTALVAVTADRPPGAVATGANQTIQQPGIFQEMACLSLTLPGDEAAMRRDLAQALQEATAGRQPLHLNVPFAKPLIDDSTMSAPTVRLGGLVATHKLPSIRGRAFVIIGPEVDLPGFDPGVPVWADAVGSTRAQLATVPAPPPASEVDAVVQVGVNPTDKVVLQWLAAWSGPRFIIDPLGRAPPGATSIKAPHDAAYGLVLDAWAWQAEWPHATGTVADLVTQSHQPIWIGNSTPVRDLQATQPRAPILGNRGCSGIDGQIASAAGAAWALDAPVTCIVGDHSYLHDLTGLEAIRGTKCEVVVLDNGGGRIFDRLPLQRDGYEELFVAPPKADLMAAAKVWGVDEQVRVLRA